MGSYRIGRHVDASLRFLGIRSCFFPMAGCALGGALVSALFLGGLLGSLAGLGVFLVLALGEYLIISFLQNRYPGRELLRRLSQRGMPERIRVRSKPWKDRGSIRKK